MKIDISKLTQQLHRLTAGIEQAVSEGLQDIAQQAAEVAKTQKTFTSHGSGSNGLVASIKPYKNSALQQGIIADKPYASWVEYGNGPLGSRIYPTKSKALHFFINGEEVFAKSVKASAPKPFMAHAANFVQSQGSAIMAQHINDFIGG